MRYVSSGGGVATAPKNALSIKSHIYRSFPNFNTVVMPQWQIPLLLRFNAYSMILIIVLL